MSDDDLINAVLAATGWSKQGLANRLGVNKSTVQDWTQGRGHPRPGVYADLRLALDDQRTSIGEVLARLPSSNTNNQPDRGGQNMPSTLATRTFDAVKIALADATLSSWYAEQHGVSLSDFSVSNVTVYGMGGMGDLADQIISDGIDAGVVAGDWDDQ